MNPTITYLQHTIPSLTVFRGMLESDGFMALQWFLNSIHDDETTDQIENYCSFVEELYKSGGNLSTFILQEMNKTDDLYLRSQIGDIPSSESISKRLVDELQILQTLSDTTSDIMTSSIDTDYPLPQYDNSSIDISQTYLEMISKISTNGYGIFANHCMFRIEDGELIPVEHPEFQKLEQLYGYQRERQEVLHNTEALANGRPASNVLLYGDAGTGKSSTVKACAAAYFDQGVRLIEFTKNQVDEIPKIAESLRISPLKFIFYIDDLSFTDNDEGFYALKGILEGNITGYANNTVIYATSNRRHLVRESVSARSGDDLHVNDLLQETLSLSARFGLTITFSKPQKDLYLEIVRQLADEYGLEYEEKDLYTRAEAFAIRASGRSPRTAKQFIILATNGLR